MVIRLPLELMVLLTPVAAVAAPDLQLPPVLLNLVAEQAVLVS
jgi:hypothetical protein